jgi:plastocyanin
MTDKASKRNSSLQNTFEKVAFSAAVFFLIAGATKPISAETWTATVGAQASDLTHTALAFLPNEFWIHAGDTIRFHFAAAELHTVSFLKPGQTRPPAFSNFGINGGVFIGCPGTTPDGSSVTGAACVTSDIGVAGKSYSVSFPNTGNFKLVCLVHVRMTGAIHVLPLSETLPHDQTFYDREAAAERTGLLSEANALNGDGNAKTLETSANAVTAGLAAIHSNGGGSQSVAVMRFFGERIFVRVGDTVEWTNRATPAAHTVTFGIEPFNDVPPSPGITLDEDGARHAVLSSPNQSVNSGLIGVLGQETIGDPETPLDITRFRVTFTAPGVFNYFCALHDDLGMKGTVVVRQ